MDNSCYSTLQGALRAIFASGQNRCSPNRNRSCASPSGQPGESHGSSPLPVYIHVHSLLDTPGPQSPVLQLQFPPALFFRIFLLILAHSTPWNSLFRTGSSPHSLHTNRTLKIFLKAPDYLLPWVSSQLASSHTVHTTSAITTSWVTSHCLGSIPCGWIRVWSLPASRSSSLRPPFGSTDVSCMDWSALLTSFIVSSVQLWVTVTEFFG